MILIRLFRILKMMRTAVGENNMLPESTVRFESGDDRLNRLYDTLLEKCEGNLQNFGRDRVLVEGGGYEKIWLETQPMGGEMFAGWDPAAALNNQLLFMRGQRFDGRMPGSIQLLKDGTVEPQYNKIQGFCFPWPALNMYYLSGRKKEYLLELEDCLRRFDDYLWKYRDSNGDGCLESFCVYDTGDDNALRYGDAPRYCETDTPPEGSRVVPMASMDVMSWSYAARDTLRRIYEILGDGDRAAVYAERAEKVRRKIRDFLWSEERGACFDRDRNGNIKPELIHNNLRCMYWGSFDQRMADAFVSRHLRSPEEFWTPLPLPSVAVNDPLFRNAPENNWSGQCEGLTWQRAILALERYGYEKIVTTLGKKWLDTMIQNGMRFTQQYDPFTGKASLVRPDTHEAVGEDYAGEVQDAYGPTMLACLGYMSHMHGIDIRMGEVWFSAVPGLAFEWEREFGGNRYLISSDGGTFRASVNGREKAVLPCGLRLITDEEGNVLRKVCLS